MAYLLVFAGLCLLLGGAEILIRGAVGLANKLDISPLIVGLTVVAFGTSAPELVVSLNAALAGAPGISIGNVVGSNIANIALVLATTAILYPVVCDRKEFIRDFGMLIFITAIFIAMAMTGNITRGMGILLVLSLVAFLIMNYARARHAGKEAASHIGEVEELSELKNKSWNTIIAAIVGGLGGVIYGAELLVEGAVELAQAYGVSEEIIGLTLIALGTSLPELATSVMAAIRKQNDMALGNVIGSNIWNILFIIGVTATVVPIPVAAQIQTFDIWVMGFITFALLPLMLTKNNLSRGEGIFFLMIYFSYIGSQVFISQNQGTIPFIHG